MLTFLRKIRQSLIESGSAQKYLLYAIGEIILVVIGILIALQINNWNEERKAKVRETNTALELLSELKQNLVVTEAELIYAETRMDYIRRILSWTRPDPPKISFEEFNYALSEASGYTEYLPLISKVEKVLRLDNFEFISSDSLDEELIEYYSAVDQVKKYHQYSVDTWKMLNQSYLVEHYTLRNFDWLPSGIGPSYHTVDYTRLLASRKLENVISAIAADVGGYISRLNDCRSQIIRLIIHIERDYSRGE